MSMESRAQERTLIKRNGSSEGKQMTDDADWWSVASAWGEQQWKEMD